MDTLYGHTDWIRSLAILSDLKLASGSSDRTIKIWNTTTGIIIQTLTFNKTLHRHNDRNTNNILFKRTKF